MNPLQTKIREAIGAASMCWEDGLGRRAVIGYTFDEKTANKIADELEAYIMGVPEMESVQSAEDMISAEYPGMRPSEIEDIAQLMRDYHDQFKPQMPFEL